MTLLKKAGAQFEWAYRQATWRARPLPEFIIIGAQKAGTSSLFEFMSQHPELSPSIRKEVHYFDGGVNVSVDNFKKGTSWYRAHFRRTRPGVPSRTFEASPLYLFNPLAPTRIAELLPGVKLIALLRNPTERAISHYFHVKRSGREPLPIDQALRAEEQRLAPALQSQDYKSEAFRLYSYKARGLYREQIDRYLKLFPREQLLLLSAEQFFADPAALLPRAFKFVGVDPSFKVRDLQPRNVSQNKSQVDPGIREYLDDYFRPHHGAVYEITGEDYGW